jgi:hypothetical protein
MMILSGAFVAPTLTVMLLQGQIPSSMALGAAYAKVERYFSPHRATTGPASNSQQGGGMAGFVGGGYRRTHVLGAGLIALSIALAFIPVLVVWAQGHPSIG